MGHLISLVKIMNEKIAVNILREVKEVLDKHQIIFWLYRGSMLGAIRNRKFILWDNDIDLCLKNVNSSRKQLLCRDLKEKKFKVIQREKKDRNDGLIAIKNGCTVAMLIPFIDEQGFSLHYLIPNHKVGEFLDYLLWQARLRNLSYQSNMPDIITKILNCFFKKIPNNLREKIVIILQIIYKKIDSYHVVEKIPRHLFEELKVIDFYDMKINIPTRAEEYAAYRYGKNWRQPDKNFIYFRDAGTVVQKCKYGELLKK